MKLSNVLISNLATFPYVHDLHAASWVDFTVSEEGNIHIFIGPNGAWKSMFLDIIQQVCSAVFFQPYTCSIKDINALSTLTEKKIIHHAPHHIHSLHENNTWVWKPSHVFITFSLNDRDRKNLHFVYKHQKEFNELIEQYSSAPIRFAYNDIDEEILECKKITCKVQIDTHTNTAWRLDSNSTHIEKFLYDFFEYFHLLQHCIAIHNALYPTPENHWHVLHATFATIGSYRNLMHYKDTYTIWNEETERLMYTLLDATTSSIKISQDHLIWFLYMKKKLSLEIQAVNPHATDEEIHEILKDNVLYKSINQFCKKYLRRTFIVKNSEHQPSTYVFSLVDKVWHQYFLDELSAGEKSMLGIVCTVYGFGLDKWLLVIDEPELHLHPQLQRQFLQIIEDLTKEYGLQCIMTTHSSLMINDKNVKYVYRFHTHAWVTHIVTPGEHYNEDTSKLMQILKFTNTAKIFFVKKIIMVEWETDEYAFSNYLQYLAKYDEERDEVIRDYEIVNINGKWGYARRKKFLHSFGIEHYFIGDWDNIQDTGNQAIDMHYYENRMRRSRRYGGYMSKSEKYKAIIQFLKSHEPKHWDEITETIEDLYKKHVFILQHGDIEAYLGMQEKWLEETVQFFQNDFKDWLRDARFDEERKELNRIFGIIFDKK